MATPDNRTLVQKADLALAELTSGGGVKQPVSANFIRIMIDASVLLPEVRTIPMAEPIQKIPNVGFLSSVLRKASDGVALSVGDRAKPDLGSVTLTTSLLKAECRITEGQLEDNVEGDRFQALVGEELMKAAGRDLENLVINGDTTLTTHAYLGTFDGLLKLTTTNSVDLTGAAAIIGRDHAKALMQTLPAQFQQNKAAMRFYTSYDAEIKQRSLLADRGTAMGDVMVASEVPVMLLGVPLKGVPLFPTTLNAAGASNETNILYCNPKESIVVGIQRNMEMRLWEEPRQDGIFLIVKMKVACKFGYEPAVAKAIKVII